MKICANFSINRFHFSLWLFLIECRFTIKLFLDIIFNFAFQIFLYLSNNPSYFLKKGDYLVSSKSFPYELNFERNIDKGLTF